MNGSICERVNPVVTPEKMLSITCWGSAEVTMASTKAIEIIEPVKAMSIRTPAATPRLSGVTEAMIELELGAWKMPAPAPRNLDKTIAAVTAQREAIRKVV